MPVIANFIAFQLGWFAVALGAAHGLPWAGTAVVLVIIAWHLRNAVRPRAELALVLSAAAIGALFDSSLAALGLVVFPNGMLLEGTAPHWMIALWMLFATTLNVSLGWLKRSLLLATAFGAVGGPLAYVGGAKLGALAIPDLVPAIAWLALGWAVLTPLLFVVSRRYDGFVHPSTMTLETSHA